ncbi:MAG: hypothetical protein ABH878_08795, partial [bacterium]
MDADTEWSVLARKAILIVHYGWNNMKSSFWKPLAEVLSELPQEAIVWWDYHGNLYIPATAEKLQKYRYYDL